jgi:hypothetical protein
MVQTLTAAAVVVVVVVVVVVGFGSDDGGGWWFWFLLTMPIRRRLRNIYLTIPEESSDSFWCATSTFYVSQCVQDRYIETWYSVIVLA